MDLSVIRNKALMWLKKNRYVVLLLLSGVVLMIIPTGDKKNDAPQITQTETGEISLGITADQLEGILSRIDGAGEVKVLLSYAAGERKVFHMNEKSSSADNALDQEYETVLVSSTDRTEDALVSHVLGPEYLGAVIICKGADDPSVKFAVSEAVSKATGLGTNRISVLKMR